MEKDNLIRILIQHAARYPEMKCQDAVKLCYQHVFGGGHLIKDPEASLAYLRKEMSETEAGDPEELLEDIGSGLVRLHLGSAKQLHISAEKINEVFVESSLHHIGTIHKMIEALQILLELSSQHVFYFNEKELRDYLEQYRQAGYPMVSHSEQYRKLYKPSYRVLLRALWEESM